MSYRHCLLLPTCCLGVVSVFRIPVFSFLIFQHLCVSSHPPCVAGWVCSSRVVSSRRLRPCCCCCCCCCSAAVSNLSAVALHLGPGSHVHPAAPASLLAGFKNPAEGHTSQFPGWEEGCLFDLGISAAAVEWTKTPDPTQQLWAAADQASLQEEASVHFVCVSLHVYPCLQLCLLILLSLCLPIMLYFISVCCHVQSPKKSQLSSRQTLMRKNFAD